jgi:hypothetical protein
MKASQLLLGGGVALALSVGARSVSAQKHVVDAGSVDRYEIYFVDNGAALVEDDRVFLLDTQTGALYRRVGSGERWTHFAKANNIESFLQGGSSAEPKLKLAIATSDGAISRLLLTNVSSGATYTLNQASGEWTPFRQIASR